MTVVAVAEWQWLWWATLGGVLIVVAPLVVLLLELLRRTVRDVDAAVSDVWTMGKRLAQNTQALHILSTTRERGGELLGELEQRAASAERR